MKTVAGTHADGKASATGKLTASGKLAYTGKVGDARVLWQSGGLCSRHAGHEDVHGEVPSRQGLPTVAGATALYATSAAAVRLSRPVPVSST